MSGEVVPESRRVAVRDLVISDEEMDPELWAGLLASDPPPLRRIPVVALADGRLWAFDDTYRVRPWQTMAPDQVVDAVLIPVEE